jgi:hypothetical protein
MDMEESRTFQNRVALLVGAIFVAAIGVTYAVMMQTTVNYSQHLTLVDTAEFQTALAVWGTLHPTGYPLYSILGGLWVQAGKWLGVGVPAAASSFSVVCAVAALGLLYRLMWRITRSILASAAGVVFLAVAFDFWLFATVAQTRMLSTVLVVLMLMLAWQYARDERPSTLAWLGFVTGLAIEQHRTSAFVAPWVFLFVVLPVIIRRKPWRALVGGAALFVAAFALYVYLPLRTWQGAAWQQTQIHTWADFWRFFTFQQFWYLHGAPNDWVAVAARVQVFVEQLAQFVSAPGLILGSLGLVAGLARREWRAFALALLASAATFLAFGAWTREVANFINMLFVADVILSIGLGLGVAEIMLKSRRWPGRLGYIVYGTLGTALVAFFVWRVLVNAPEIWKLTKSHGGEQVIANASAAVANVPNAGLLIEWWSWETGPLQYAQFVTGELSSVQLLSPDDNLRRFLRRGGRLYSHYFIEDQMDPGTLKAKLGRYYLRSAAPGMIEIMLEPRTAPDMPLDGSPTPMGDEMTLLGYKLTCDRLPRTLALALYWRADRKPSADYSVFVHASDKLEITQPQDLIAQADSLAPVYGRYATSRWDAGEVVRDDYRIQLPPDKAALLVNVGLYTQDAGGAFHDLGVAHIRASDLNCSGAAR